MAEPFDLVRLHDDLTSGDARREDAALAAVKRDPCAAAREALAQAVTAIRGAGFARFQIRAWSMVPPPDRGAPSVTTDDMEYLLVAEEREVRQTLRCLAPVAVVFGGGWFDAPVEAIRRRLGGRGLGVDVVVECGRGSETHGELPPRDAMAPLVKVERALGAVLNMLVREP
jgi:hypothetical protein